MRTAYATSVLQEAANQAEVPTPLRGLPQSAAVLTYVGALPLIIAALLIVVSPDIYGAAARGFMQRHPYIRKAHAMSHLALQAAKHWTRKLAPSDKTPDFRKHFELV